LDFIERFHAQGGKYLFLDEVHKYRGWSLEVKNAYDEFEDMHIVLSGSSLINLIEGEADLSRRCITYTMQGLSFREYLRMFHQKDFRKRTLQEILTDGNSLCAEINAQLRPLPLFSEYLRTFRPQLAGGDPAGLCHNRGRLPCRTLRNGGHTESSA
jgi:predicted AAA+ superfamily ATPase